MLRFYQQKGSSRVCEIIDGTTEIWKITGYTFLLNLDQSSLNVLDALVARNIRYTSFPEVLKFVLGQWIPQQGQLQLAFETGVIFPEVEEEETPLILDVKIDTKLVKNPMQIRKWTFIRCEFQNYSFAQTDKTLNFNVERVEIEE